MPIEQWSESVVVARLADGPAMADDLLGLEQRLGQQGVDAVLDFTGVTFITSADIARLLQVRKRIVTADRRLVLCGMTEPVRQVFHLAGFMQLFKVEPSQDAAFARLASPS